MSEEIKIISTSIEEHKSISEKLKSLDAVVLEQIESAEKGFDGVKCHFKRDFRKTRNIILPNDTMVIHEHDKEIRVIMESFDFEIPKNEEPQLFCYKILQNKK